MGPGSRSGELGVEPLTLRVIDNCFNNPLKDTDSFMENTGTDSAHSCDCVLTVLASEFVVLFLFLTVYRSKCDQRGRPDGGATHVLPG